MLFGREDIDKTVQELRREQSHCDKRCFLEYAQQLFYNKDDAATREDKKRYAAWVLNNIDEDEVLQLIPIQNQIVDLILTTSSSTLRRLALNIINRLPITEDNFRTDLLDFCLERMVALDEPSGVQAICMKQGYKMCSMYAELMQEFRQILKNMDTAYYKPAVTGLRRKMLKCIVSQTTQQHIVKKDVEQMFGELLFELRDAQYAQFQSKLIPTVAADKFIGVRQPELRKLAHRWAETPESIDFLCALPHPYHDCNMLHALLLSEIKDFEMAAKATTRFLPYIDNWAVCDSLSPKIFRKHHSLLLPYIKRWAASPHVFTCRFGIKMLMDHFLDKDFEPTHLTLPTSICQQRADIGETDYYVQMMIAFFFATALAKQWDDTIPYIERNRLTPWVQNKTIQKACESFRITAQQKEYLKMLKIK